MDWTVWIARYPEMEAWIGTPQHPGWQPEVDVVIHAGYGCDALAQREAWQKADEESRLVWMRAVLAHDLGKPACTREEIKHGRRCIVSPGHEEAGGPVAESFLERIHAPLATRRRVLPLVLNHMAHLQSPSDRAVRRLARRLSPETIHGLTLMMPAASLGRPPRPPVVPATIRQLQARAEELQIKDSAPQPLLQGRHLIESGLPPGPEFQKILHAAFEAQLEGVFSDLAGARHWLGRQHKSPEA